jgi:hypothetical protein
MPALDILALDTATPQVRVPSASDTYRLPRAVAIAAGTLTSDIRALDLTATWNSGATTFTGLRFNVTDTASNAASLLMDLQVGGASRFSVRKNGNVESSGEFRSAIIVGTAAVFGGSYNLTTNSGEYRLGGSNDVALARDAANTLALRNGTAAQEFRLYRNFTGASDFGYTGLRQDATTGFILDSVNLGSVGAPTDLLRMASNGTVRIRVGANSALLGQLGGFWSIGLNYTTASFGGQSNSLSLGSNTQLCSSSSDASAPPDIGLVRLAAGQWGVIEGATTALRDLKLRSAIQVPPASLTFSNNGEWGVEMTSNTAGNLVYRGSDGTTRRCALVFV